MRGLFLAVLLISAILAVSANKIKTTAAPDYHSDVIESMVKSVVSGKKVDVMGMVRKYGLTSEDLLQFALAAKVGQANSIQSTSEHGLAQKMLQKVDVVLNPEIVINNSSTSKVQKRLMTMQDEVKLQAAGLYALLTKESQELQLNAEQNVLNSVRTITANLTAIELCQLLDVLDFSVTQQMINMHDKVMLLMSKAIAALKQQKDRLSKIYTQAQIKSLAKQGLDMKAALQQIKSFIPGVRIIGSEYISPGDSCNAIYSAGDKTDGLKWIHPSQSVSSYYTRQVLCQNGFDLVGKSSRGNTKPFTFKADIETDSLLSTHVLTSGKAQYDLSGYTKYISYDVKIIHAGHTIYIKPSCTVDNLASVCSSMCHCQISSDGVHYSAGSTANEIPLSDTIVFLRQLNQTSLIQ